MDFPSPDQYILVRLCIILACPVGMVAITLLVLRWRTSADAKQSKLRSQREPDRPVKLLELAPDEDWTEDGGQPHVH